MLKKTLIRVSAGLAALFSFGAGSFVILRKQAITASDAVKRAALQETLKQGFVITKEDFAWQNLPPTADGIYTPDGRGPLKENSANKPELSFAILGDSTSVGYGCNSADEFPGVLITKQLVKDFEKSVKLSTCGKIGATSLDLQEQLVKLFESNPDVVLILIGANDIRHLISIKKSSKELKKTVLQMVERDIKVIVGTCPDLNIVKSIPQPLRFLVSIQSRKLAKVQEKVVKRAGGIPVALGEKLKAFIYSDNDFFYVDEFHPSAQGYRRSVEIFYPFIKKEFEFLLEV